MKSKKKYSEQHKEYEIKNQDNIVRIELINILKEKTNEIKKSKERIREGFLKKKHLLNELQQEKHILSESNKQMENKLLELEESNEKLRIELNDKSKESNELSQEKILLKGIGKNKDEENFKIKKKYYTTFAMAGIILVGVLVSSSTYMTSLIGEEHQVSISDSIKSGYVIQNLRGDTIDTFLSWKLVKGDTLHVNIINSANIEPELIEAVKNVIFSNEKIEVDNSLLHKGPKGTTTTMFFGWQGALNNAAKTETILNIPVNFEIIESTKGLGDITIELSSKKSADGFNGWTSSIADETQNQILKSRITIFDAKNLSQLELETIVRHEFGHALGLAHSSAPEDLMYPTIETNFPYISECNLDAITLLYDGGKTSQVICEI